MAKKLKCLWCGSENLTSQHIDKKIYFTCSTCTIIFLDPRFRLQQKDEKTRYEQHENDVLNPGYQNFVMPIKNEVGKRFSTQSLGLDYGCGKASAISYLLSIESYKIEKYDPYFFPDTEVIKSNAYDYIILCEVAEHFYQPKEEFEKLFKLLKPGGVIFVMTSLLQQDTNFSTWSYRRDATHVCFYTEKTFSLKFKTQVLVDNFVVLSL